MATLFYLCPLCGNVVAKIEDGGTVPSCCGKQMTELHPGTTEASAEKHIPVLETLDDRTMLVKVGSEAHPMTPQHHINWIWVETGRGGQLRYLSCESGTAERAEARFHVCKEHVTAVYAYCNIHGLWKCDTAACHAPRQAVKETGCPIEH